MLNWHFSNTLDTSFYLEILDESFKKYGHPEIFNSDQGLQFTSKVFMEKLQSNKVSISMDGKDRCHDNIFIDRLWRSLKYEEVYYSGINWQLARIFPDKVKDAGYQQLLSA